MGRHSGGIHPFATVDRDQWIGTSIPDQRLQIKQDLSDTMKQHWLRYSGLFVLLCSYWFTFKLYAGTIEGTVYSHDGRRLSNVVVRASQRASTHYAYDTTTDTGGHYVLQNLSTGEYIVRVVNVSEYVDEYYPNAYNPSEAEPLKITQESHISRVDFYLDEGGFITGRVLDGAGRPIRNSINVGFYDPNTETDRGYCASDEFGRYISPALPAGYHVVLAGLPGLGYITMYYRNAHKWEDAVPVEVTVGDTVKGIDFQLYQGGAIEGYVMDNSDSPQPIPAWIVVEDWETGQWCSEAFSDTLTGYFLAGGLLPGTYRVYIYSVDPTRYHTASFPTPVVIAGGDTVSNIRFSLSPVTYTRVRNDFVEVVVSDLYPGSNFSMQTIAGLPDTPWDDHKPLLFGHPWPNTSYTSIRIDDKDVVFASDAGAPLDKNGRPDVPTEIKLPGGEKAISWTWVYENVYVEQTVALVESKWSRYQAFDTAMLQYRITNHGASRMVGLRILFDTMLGDNDGAPIRTSNDELVQRERLFVGDAIPAWWTALEGDETRTVFSAQGTMRGYGATQPDRFAVVKWRNIFYSPWEY